MPTDRPRHVITETDAVARALDDAARRWPEQRERRGQLIVRLLEEGHRALGETTRRQVAQRTDAVARGSGALTGLYGRGYLDDMRRDWPA